jgi:hypothetical protein
VPKPLRRFPKLGDVDYGTYSVIVPVTSSRPDHFVCQLNRDNWIRGGHADAPDPGKELRGMSGGPVLIASGRVDLPIVGLVTEYSPAYDLVYVRTLSVLSNNGR